MDYTETCEYECLYFVGFSGHWRQDLSLLEIPMQYIPSGITFHGYLDLSGCEKLIYLPTNIVVYGFLDLSGCTTLSELSDGLCVGGDLDLSWCHSLKAIPPDIKVGEDVLAYYCSMKNISIKPKGVKGKVYVD